MFINNLLTSLRLLSKSEKKILTNPNRHIIKYEKFDGGIAQSVERRNHNPCVVGSNPSLATIKKRPLYEVFFLWILNLGFEPERARAHRKHQSNGVFVASGDVLLMSCQATTVNVTERTHKIPLSLSHKDYLFSVSTQRKAAPIIPALFSKAASLSSKGVVTISALASCSTFL